MGDLAVRRITGTALAVHGNDIDTDRIIPARYLKALTFSELGRYPFHDERFDADGRPREHPFNREACRGAAILLVNSNFGCGSSREHAPQALRRWGIRALVGVSFAEIFAGNCEMLGMPAACAPADEVAKLQAAADADPRAGFRVDLDRMEIRGAGLGVSLEMPGNRRRALLEGHWDSTGVLVANAGKVREVCERLPYVRGYR